MIASLTLAVALAAPAAAPKPGVRPLPAVIDPAANATAPRVLDLKPDADGKVRVTVTRMEKQKVTIGVGGGPAPADENAPAPARPPIVREFTAPKEVRVELSEVKDLVVTTADGKAIDTKDALKKLADGGAVIATANGKPVDPKFLKALRDDTLVLVSPELVVGHAAAGFGGNGGIILDNGVVPLPAPAPGVPVKPIARPLPKPIVRPLPAPVPGVQLPEKE